MTLAAPGDAFDPRKYLAEEADKQGAPRETLENIIKCESGWKAGAVGDNGNALGRAQFWQETFYRMQKASGDNPMYKWGDERTELRLLAWAGANGHLGEWTCARKAPG